MSRKASNIIELARSGVAVPRGFHLDHTHYREAIASARDAIVAAARDAAAVHRIFADIALPDRTVAALQEGLNGIPSVSPLAVRSSGNIVTKGRKVAEDGGEQSLAGQFESFLNVPRTQVGDAVRLCWASLFNERSISLFDVDEDYIENSAMTVLIQEMVPAAASAVVMTVDPLDDGTVGGIELAIGPCEAIVGGAVTPDAVMFHRESGQILERHVGAKEFAIEYRAFARGVDNVIKRSLPQDVRDRLAVTDKVLLNIVDVARVIERIFGKPQDIELVIDPADKITVVQSRAITRLPDTIIPFGRPQP
jgi:phosphoenolpyruvate synthase/pyruvate phosphate dikinase